MLCITNVSLKKLVQQYSSYDQMFLKQVNPNYGSADLRFFVLYLKGEASENDGNNFKVLLHFEAAIVAE